jgi:hypothetical protein
MSSNRNAINVLYWNANGISTKIHEFYQFLRDKHIDVACVAETFLSDLSRLPCDPAYTFHRLDRSEKAKGGVAIAVSKQIRHKLIRSINTQLIENVGVEIELENGSRIQIFSCYLPGGTRNAELNKHYAADLKKLHSIRSSFFHCGDFNSRHRMWNCARANRAGTILHDEYNSHNFLIEFPDDHTHFPADPNKNPSTLDLVLSNGLHCIDDLKTTDLMSDHVAVSFKISTNAAPAESQRRLQHDFNKADWDRYKRIINFHATLPDFGTELASVTEVDRAVSKLTDLITHARDRAVPLCFHSKYRLQLPDWLLDIINYKNAVKRRWKRNRTVELKAEVNLLETHIKECTARIRNKNWNLKLESIRPSNQSVWKTARFLKKGPRQLPPLSDNGTIVITSIDKANLIADSFACNHENPIPVDRAFARNIRREVDRIRSDRTSPPEADLPTIDEIKSIIKCLPNNKAPGRDNIKNCLIKNMPESGFKLVSSIVVACHKHSYFPAAWRSADVVPILKPQKDPRNPSSYRPISLLSGLSKVLERTILTRLNRHCDEHNIIPDTQHGFRTGKSTVHQLRNVISHARESLAAGKSTGLIALDVEKAFDRVYHDGLIYKMAQYEFPTQLTSLVDSFLNGRTFRVAINGQPSASHRIKYGVPQGAVISPCLYSIFTSDLPSSMDHKTALFADDVAKFKSARSANVIVNGLTKAAKTTHKYMKKWRITVNGQKTQAIFITRRRKRQLPPRTISLFGADVSWSRNIKYLGLFIDKKLTFATHIDYVLTRANNAIKVLYPLLARNSKLHVANKLLLYKLAIRPIITYGTPALKGIAKSHIKKLQVAQNKALKMILNRAWYTSTAEIHALANIPMIGDYIDSLTAKFESRLVDC